MMNYEYKRGIKNQRSLIGVRYLEKYMNIE